MLSLHGALIAAAVLGAVWLAVAHAALGYYGDPVSRHPLASAVAILTLAVAAATCAITPLEHVALANDPDQMSGFERAYHLLHAVILVVGFGVVPFTYYFVEVDDDATPVTTRLTRLRRPLLQKAVSALRQTLLSLLLLAALLGCLALLPTALIVAPSATAPPEPARLTAQLADRFLAGQALAVWQALRAEAAAVSPVQLAVCVLGALGSVGWVAYTPYGLVMLPAALLQARPDEFRPPERPGMAKWWATGGGGDADDVGRLGSVVATLSNVVRRPRLALGWASAASSAGVVASSLLSLFDVGRAYTCGLRCAILDSAAGVPSRTNPLDSSLVALSASFPLDLLLLSSLLAYLTLTTLFAISALGLRAGCILIYRLRPHRTSPQAGARLAPRPPRASPASRLARFCASPTFAPCPPPRPHIRFSGPAHPRP